MDKAIELLQNANRITRSFNTIIKRKGQNTSWSVLEVKIENALKEQHEFLELGNRCEHKYVFNRSISYWSYCGRNSREYYQADCFFCEKCLQEKIIERRHSCYDSDLYNLPAWAKVITNKIKGYE